MSDEKVETERDINARAFLTQWMADVAGSPDAPQDDAFLGKYGPQLDDDRIRKVRNKIRFSIPQTLVDLVMLAAQHYGNKWKEEGKLVRIPKDAQLAPLPTEPEAGIGPAFPLPTGLGMGGTEKAADRAHEIAKNQARHAELLRAAAALFAAGGAPAMTAHARGMEIASPAAPCRSPIVRAFQFLAQLNMQDHSIADQREAVEIVRQLKRILKPEG